MNGLTDSEPDCSEYVEVDPTGRYGRYNEVLGRGATKTVYRAFDEYKGIEVAWNQVKLHDFLRSPHDLERLYCEIHLLKTLKHKSIMKFYTSWVDTSRRHINFVTEMFTSGTLRQYRLKHQRVNIQAVKHWCRQILKGLLYLHNHDPPVIHRDLKCDNIFVNGNQGEVKIGDLGLAAILRKSHAAHCVGTPEFMAPEIYEEEYNELVDIYSFGMCILEMVTFEYPYSECTNPAHIYKKVISGKKPDALYKVKDPEVRQFIEKCLATVLSRLSARELLNDPFLQIDDSGCDLRSKDYQREVDGIGPLIRHPYVDRCISDYSHLSWHCNNNECEPYNDEERDYSVEIETSAIELFEHYDEEEHFSDMDITIKGKRREDGSVFLRLRIADKDGLIRNIYFSFDVEMDTALSVATEMVAELDITDQDVTCIADMIDEEISSLIPEWKSGPEIEETASAEQTELFQDSASDHTSISSFMESLSINQGAHHFIQISDGCAATHGRFEEITYQIDGSEHEAMKGDELPFSSKQPNSGTWNRQRSVEFSSFDSGFSHSDDTGKSEKPILDKHKNICNRKDDNLCNSACCVSLWHEHNISVSDHFGKDFQLELRWIKAKHQLEVRQIRDQILGFPSKFSTRSHVKQGDKHKTTIDPHLPTSDKNAQRILLTSDNAFSSSSSCYSPHCREPTMRDSINTENTKATANKSFCAGSLLPSVLQRTTSLPVDAVHMQW